MCYYILKDLPKGAFMSFLSPTFMFLFLPIAMAVLLLTPKERRSDILPVAGIVFFVCANISAPFALLYISFVSASVIVAMAIYKKTQNKLCLYIFAAVFFSLGGVILTLRMFSGSSIIQGAGVVMCLMSSVSLCLDVAKGTCRVPESLWDGVTYVVYFPTMLIGPFISYEDFTARERKINTKRFARGTFLFLKGFVKAIFIGAILGDAFKGAFSLGADNMGLAIALLLAALQSLSLYAFFSGYSDIARGVSLMVGLGIESDMGNPFFNLTPSEYLRGFFKGFSAFFKRYIAAPVISRLGENLFNRILSSLLSAAVLLLLFCQNHESLLLLLPFTAAAEYFVLFGRSSKRRPSLVRRCLGYIVTFTVISIAWAIVSSSGSTAIVESLRLILSNDIFYLSYSASGYLLNLKYLVIPAIGCVISCAASYVMRNDKKADEGLVPTVLKYLTATILLLCFAL